MNKTYLTTLLAILTLCGASWSVCGQSVTNKIAKEMSKTGYSGVGKTVKQAKADHEGTWLTCIQYCFRIKDIADKSGLKSQIWETSGKHAIIEVKEGSKTYTYSNGKLVRSSAYSKIRKIR